MKDPESTRFSRQELGDFLIALGEQLRRGAFQAEGRSWPVPDEVAAEIHLKEKKGRIVAKIKWQWPTLAAYGQPARQEVQAWQASFKTVKNRLALAFRELQRQVSQGQLPAEAALRDFMESSQAFAALGVPEWQGALQEYLDHAANLQLAVDSRQLEQVRHELRDLAARLAACHREFK